MVRIVLMKAKKDQLILSPAAEEMMRNYFDTLYKNRGRDFANAREVNEYFARVKTNQSSRIRKRMDEPDFRPEEYTELIAEDMAADKNIL